MPITVSYNVIKDRLADNTLILTPNARTQKAITAGYLSSLKEGDVVTALSVRSFSQWQAELWQELSFNKPLPRVVGGLALKAWLKEQISADENWQLTNELGVAEKILEAYRTLSQWHLSVADIGDTETLETQYFCKWVASLENFLLESNLIPQFSLLKELLASSDVICDLLPKDILLVGFNQFTPLENDFWQFCEKQGVNVEDFYPQRKSKNRQRIEFNELAEELDFAARTAFKLTEESPNSSIGIVVHQLSNHLDSIHQIFSERFQAEELLPWRSLEKTRYNVSAGQSLVMLPMVSVALKILQFNTSGFDLQTLQLIKTSPFIDWGENANFIRRFIHKQCLKGYSQYSLDALLKSIDKDNESERLELLTERINGLKNRPARARPMSAWVDLWKNELKQWGWLQSYQCDESESKLLGEFYATLAECLTLGQIYVTSNQLQAKEYLLQVLRQATFQLPSDRTNVHVLGILEATGLEFDHLILAGFNRENWPQKAKLNPFLPVAFQQQHQMPGSSAEREFVYTKSLTESLLNGADNIWVTQSKGDKDTSPESSFFSNIQLVEDNCKERGLSKPGIQSDYIWRKDESIDLPTGDIKGGAYLLSYYASCPFKAMSNFQFNLHPAQQSQKGIDAKVKGAWLHRALELFWQKLKTQSALKVLNTEQISDFIEEVLKESQVEFESQLHATASVEIIQLEYEKLYLQIEEWVDIELQRMPFEVETEVEKSLAIGPLTFKFRVDRLDTIENGAIDIIDYKTGQTDVKKWLGPRPDEAQMPAYVLACEGKKVNSLSYAKIKTGEVSQNGVWFDESQEHGLRFLDISSENKKDKTKRILANPELIRSDKSLPEQWRDNLENLAHKISKGDMPVSPKNENDSCRYCDFADFCRIKELQPEGDNP